MCYGRVRTGVHALWRYTRCAARAVLFLVLMIFWRSDSSFPLAFGESVDGTGSRYAAVVVIVITVAIAVASQAGRYERIGQSRDQHTLALLALVFVRIGLGRRYSTKKAACVGERLNRSGKGDAYVAGQVESRPKGDTLGNQLTDGTIEFNTVSDPNSFISAGASIENNSTQRL